MVVFLAHWCPHCNDEIPVLLEWRDVGRHPGRTCRSSASARRSRDDAPNFPPEPVAGRQGLGRGRCIADDAEQTAAPGLRRDGLPVLRRSSAPTARVKARTPASSPSTTLSSSPTPPRLTALSGETPHNERPTDSGSAPGGGDVEVVGDRAVGAEHDEAVEAAQEPAVVGDGDDGAGELRPGRPRAPRPTRGRGCRSARRAAAAWRPTARAAGSGSAPAGRPTACRTAARRTPAARSGAASPSPGRARRRGRGGCRAACRPVHSGCSWVWWNSPGTTPAPRRHDPSCPTVSSPASRRRKWLLPAPLPPSTATRSPNQSSRSNGSVSPSSSSRSMITARLPVRAPPRRTSIRCSRTSARPLVALVELAQPALGRLQLGRERVGDLGPPAHLGDEVLEPLALVVVQRPVAWRACRGAAWRASW